MIFSTAFWAAFGVVGAGVGALCANPNRTINGTLFVASLHVGLAMLCWHLAVADGADADWIRVTALFVAAFPAHAWFLKDAISRPELTVRDRLGRCRGWLGFAVIMAVWAVTDFFIVGRGQAIAYGEGFYAYLFALAAAAGLFGFFATLEMHAQSGVRRIEVQVLILGLCGAGLAALVLTSLGAWLNELVFFTLTPLAVLFFFVGMVWALVSSRVLDALHLLSLALERAVLLAGMVLCTWSVQEIAQQFISTGPAYVASLAAGLWFAAQIHPWLQRLFKRSAELVELRRQAIEVARKEVRPEAMEDGFLKLIQRATQAERAVILLSSQSRLIGGGMEFAIESPAMKALHAMRWITPERLERERNVPERAALEGLLSENGFGVVVASAGPALSFALGVGVPVTRRPYTYPEVVRLMELAAIVENAVSRARYLSQAQHAEQLATVGMLGASIAHEIRNPLVTIKTFVQLLPDHHHDAAFREKFFRLIGDEVGRIDRLTEQLLDLAAPRVFAAKDVEIHALLRSCLDLVAAKAEDKGVVLIPDFQAESDRVQTDPSAVKQVILNLSFNAIQALEQREGERWVRFETRQKPDNLEIIVKDSGPGIKPEVAARLFQPFQSTKSSGFGLGLAICKDILSSLQASISADPPVAGCGAAFRIVLPYVRNVLPSNR